MRPNSKRPKGAMMSRLSNVICVDWNLVVGRHKIDLGEEDFTSKMRCKVLDVRQRVPVRGNGVFKPLAISTWTSLTVFLHNHMKRRRPCTRRWPDGSHIQELVELGFCSDELLWRMSKDLSEDRATFSNNVGSDTVSSLGVTGAECG